MEPSPYSPAERVFVVAELCEAILLHADIADVLRARRVSRAFDKTFTRSKPIRRKVFLEPDSESDRTVFPLPPAFFRQLTSGYRDTTIAIRVDMVDLWASSEVLVEPLWKDIFISQPPPTTCVIPVDNHSLTRYTRRVYPQGMTFGDLQRAIIAAYDIKKVHPSRRERLRERLEELSASCDPALIYWR